MAPHFRGKRVSVVKESEPPTQQRKKPKAKGGVQGVSKRMKTNLPPSEMASSI